MSVDSGELRVRALGALPEVLPGADLAALVAAAADGPLPAGAVLVLSHKVVSKAEGRVVDLRTVAAGDRAVELAGVVDRDPRLVQVVLDQSSEVLRAVPGVLITRTHHGFVCANAGVDRSNVPGEDRVVLLPHDPDASARALREALPGRPAVVIADSFGRAWRHGQAEVAIGCAGLRALEDHRGAPDREGRVMEATLIAVADHLASAADLVRGKTTGRPAVLIRGAERHVTAEHGAGAAPLRRERDRDLFGA